MDWKEAYITRVAEFVDGLETDLDFLTGHQCQLIVDGEDVLQVWLDRYRERAEQMRTLLEVASIGRLAP